jgi:hypothetical protein
MSDLLRCAGTIFYLNSASSSAVLAGPRRSLWVVLFLAAGHAKGSAVMSRMQGIRRNVTDPDGFGGHKRSTGIGSRRRLTPRRAVLRWFTDGVLNTCFNAPTGM